MTRSFSEELDNDWFEAALGANYRVAENAFVYFDVERDFGARIETKWKATLGSRLWF